MTNDTRIAPKIKIVLDLKKKQCKSHNIWECTILGTERTLTWKKVEFYLERISDIPNSFDLDEVEKVEIEITNFN